MPGTNPRMPTSRNTAPKSPETICTCERVLCEAAGDCDDIEIFMTILSPKVTGIDDSEPMPIRMAAARRIVVSVRRCSLVAMGAWAVKLWRRLLVLLIGGVVAVPYIAVIIWVVTAWNEASDRSLALGIFVFGIIVFILLCIPAFLAVIRALERTLAEQLLELSIPTPPRRPTASDRVRGALFYFGHAFAGALLLLTVVVVIPSASLMIADPQQASELSNGLLGIAGSTGGPTGGGGDSSAGPWTEPAVVLPAGLIQILAPLVLLLLAAFIITEGYFLPHYAQILLGSSAADRAALAGADRVRRFRRTVLAREVHDSIGHALTVMTMQAAVAKRALHHDEKLAEAAVDEIARTGRDAVAELDHVLALLRAEADAEGTVSEIEDLVGGAGAIAGTEADVGGIADDGDSGSCAAASANDARHHPLGRRSPLHRAPHPADHQRGRRRTAHGGGPRTPPDRA